MSLIPQSFIDDLLLRLDIVSIIDSRVPLKRSGKNYSACCPFHQEKTPSFTVSADKQFYYCFGCGASGNALNFVIDYERLGFVDAVESLARSAGLDIPRQQSPQESQRASRRKQQFATLDAAARFYRQQLRQHPKKVTAVNYLRERGLSGDIAQRYSLGFAPPGYRNLLQALGNSEDNRQRLIDTGMLIHKAEDNKQYDRFRQRIMFPIRDQRGRVIGFGGRVLGDDKPKYLNSPESELFHKSRELYGLYEAKQACRQLSQLLIVEGYMDVIALAQYGIDNAVATLGTACGEEHLRLAFRTADHLTFCFDGDQAGRKAAQRALHCALATMEDGRQIRFLFLPEGQDPDTRVRQLGAEQFRQDLDGATPLEDFLFDIAGEGLDLSTMEGRARLSKMAAPMIATLPESIYRELMFDKLASHTGLDRKLLDQLCRESQDSHQQNRPQTASPAVATSDPAPDIATIDPQHPAFGTPFSRDTAPTREALAPQPLTGSGINISPAKTAIILLVGNPGLLQSIDPPTLDDDGQADSQRLKKLIAYLQQHPTDSFNSLIGHWGGTEGLDEQQYLAHLIMSNEQIRSVKQLDNYNAAKELQDALACLHHAQAQHRRQRTLSQLKTRALNTLSEEEKRQLIQLSKG